MKHTRVPPAAALMAALLLISGADAARAQSTGANGGGGGFALYSGSGGSHGGSGGAGGVSGDGSNVTSGSGGTGGSTGPGGTPGSQAGSGPYGGAAGNASGSYGSQGGGGGGAGSGGGSGGIYGQASGGGGGGGGGAGAVLSGTLNNTTTITGGNGGNGSPGAPNYSQSFAVAGGGGGGGGGSGVVATTGTSITNSGSITGGNGGYLGYGQGANYNPFSQAEANGGGGAGGHGIEATGSSGLTIINTGTIQGGNGNADIQGFHPQSRGVGGTGITGQNLTIINSGTIAGGNSANAITITGGINSIQMLGGNAGAILLSAGSTDISGTFTNTLTANGGTSVSVSTSSATGITTFTNNGTVTIGAGLTLSATSINNNGGSISIGAGATLQGTGNTLNNNTVINVGTGGNVVDAGDINNNGGAVINFNGPGGTATLSSGTNTINNAGQINVISGDVAVTGNINNNGTLALTGGNMSGVGTLTTSGTLTVAATYILGVQTFTLAGGSVNGSGTISASTAFNFSGGSVGTTLAGIAGLTTTGGTTILTGANTYSGGTTISGGTLQIGNGGTTGSITGNVSNSGTLAFNRSDASVFSGAISGTGTVEYLGSGTMILAGTNTYSGGTTISAGTLQIGNGSTTGSITGNVSNSGTLAFNRSDATMFSGVISGTGAVQHLGGGTTILTGTNTYSGGTTISAGTLQIGSGGTTGSITGDVTNNAALVFSRSDTITFGGTISGTGSVEQAGGGVTVLTGNNSYSGGTTVSGGTLSLGHSNAAGTGAITTTGSIIDYVNGVDIGNQIVVNSGTTQLQVLAVSAEQSGVISESGGSRPLEKTGAGMLVLSAANTYTGLTTISAGTLQIGNGGTTGSIIGDIANNATLTFNRSNSITYGGSISGSGELRQIGGGTTILTGNSTYFGGTTITGGTLQIGDGGTTGAITGDVSNSGTLAFNRNDTSLFGGTISGAGAIQHLGTGTTILTATNTYFGGTTISAGTLQLGNGGTSGALNGSVTVAAGASFAFNRSDTYGFAGTISGAGNVVQAGSGTTAFGDGMTYTGETQILAGTLQIGNGGSEGSIGSGDILNDATLAINRSNAYTLTNDVSGNGRLQHNGNGTTTLTGTNTYTGATEVNAGTLRGGAVNVFAGNSEHAVVTGATLNLNNFDQTIGSLSGAGNVTLGTATLTTGGNNASTTFAGVISGDGGLTKTGTGTLTFTGANTYTGRTNVNAGRLAIDSGASIVSTVTLNGGEFVNNGSALGTLTANGGTIGGSGTFGDTNVTGGTLAPGNSIGTITIQGNLVFTAASTYLIEFDPTASDRTNVTGTATLGGATVSAIYANGSYVSKRYTILNATGGVSGTFNTLVNTNLPTNFTPTLSYDANNAYLNLTLNFTPTPADNPTPGDTPTPTPTPGFGNGLTGNQNNVANALINSFNTAGGIPLVFGALTPAGLTQISGEAATGTQQTTFDAMDRFVNLMTDPFIREQGGAGSQPHASAYAAMTAKALPRGEPFAGRWSVWGAGYGGTQSTSGDAIVGSQRTTNRIFASAAGADYRFSADTMVGVGMGGAGTSYHLANGLGRGSSEMFQAGIYGRHHFGAAYAAGALAYGWQDVTTDRNVFLSDLRGRFDANALSGRIEGGYRFATGMGGLTPYAAGQFATFWLPGYAEQVLSGINTFALAYASKDVIASRSELGLRADISFAMQDARVILRGRAAWAHNFDTDRSVMATFQTLPVSTFAVNGAAPAHDAALVTASAEARWLNGFSVAATFDSEFSRVTESYTGKGALRYQW